MQERIFISLFLIIHVASFISTGNCTEVPAESRLQEHLLSMYSWPVRPVGNYSNRLTIYQRYKLLRIVELNLKEEIITLSIQVNQEWTDYKFKWNPEDFGGITQTSLPSDRIWLPDFTLYRSVGAFELKEASVLVYSNGLVKWRPMALAKCYCPIHLQHYPFDIQSCNLRFASWTHDANLLFLTLKDLPVTEREKGGGNLTVGMDLDAFTPSTEWALISIPAQLYLYLYPEFDQAFTHVSLTITVRRHSRFYMANLVLPLIGLSYLSLLVFYLPADSGEKITLCVSLLTSQVTFLLLMIDNLPVTSLAVPLLAKLIIFNMLFIFSSIICTTIVLNIHYRMPSTNTLPKWVKNLREYQRFLSLLRMKGCRKQEHKLSKFSRKIAGNKISDVSKLCTLSLKEVSIEKSGIYCGKLARAVENVCFIREHITRQIEEDIECEHWKFLAAVIDRVFFIVFHVVYFVCISLLLIDAQALYDNRMAIGEEINWGTYRHYWDSD